MNFELNEDQRQIAASVERLLGDVYGFEQRRWIVAAAEGWSPDVWASFGELGLPGLLVPEVQNGLGGGAVDLLPVMQAFGRSLLAEPFLASAVLGACAIRHGGDEAQRQRLLPEVATGALRLAWAHDEPAGRHAPLWVEATASRRDGNWVINGLKSLVLHAPDAHYHVVSARTEGAPDASDGLGLFLVDAQASGLSCRPFRLVDDTVAGELRLDGVEAELLGGAGAEGTAAPAIGKTRDLGAAAVCADMLGAMEGAYALTVDYVKTREQFGRAIGENQAVRHRVVDMYVALEMSRAMAMAAALSVDDPAAEYATADLVRAKMLIGRRAHELCRAAIQLHGGIGMTEEYPVGHYLRRVTVLDQLFGDADAHETRLTALVRDADAVSGASAPGG